VTCPRYSQLTDPANCLFIARRHHNLCPARFHTQQIVPQRVWCASVKFP
jgi:hypothetical protein